MANTVIALKKSATPSAVPSSLANGELAINYADGKLFYKNTAGQIAEISGGGGGNYFGTVNANNVLIVSDTPNDILTIEAGDNITIVGDAINDKIIISASGGTSVDSFARDTANAAFDKANSANVLAFNTGISANSYADTIGAAANGWSNTVASYANSYADSVGTASNTIASGAFTQSNTARVHANTAHETANAAFDKANAANVLALSAYDVANSALPKSGGTITGNLEIEGNLRVFGNVFTFSANNLVVNDPFILLANNNTGDVLDIGFSAHYANITDDILHTGLFRSANTKEWYLFKNYDNHFFYDGGTIDLSGNNFTLDVLNAEFKTSNLELGGVNAISWITDSYEQANTARDHANVAFEQANAAFDQANTGGGGGAYFQGNNGDVGQASGLGDIFRVHTNILTANVTIYSGNNALAAGPITIQAGKSLTIQDNARVVIV